MKKKELEKIFPDLTEEQFKEIVKIENLAYERGKADTAASYDEEEKQRQINDVIKSAGAKNEKAVKALLDLDKVSVENGEVKGLQEQIDELKKTCEYLFNCVSKKPQFTTQSKGSNDVTKKDFENMSYQKRLKLFSENPELYKRLANR